MGSSGNDEETEDGSTVYRRRSRKEIGHGRWRRDATCCAQEETDGVMVLDHRECGDHQGNDTSGEMAMEDH